MVVCLQGATISLDLCKSLEESECGKVLSRVHLNLVFEGTYMSKQAP